MDVPTEPLGIGDPPLEELLPGIPNEITLIHIAPKLPWRAFPVLSSVSRGWRLALRTSHQFYEGRVCSNSTETLAVVSVKLCNHTNAIVLYSVRDERLYYVPEIPLLGGFPSVMPMRSLGSKFSVLGGVKDSSTQLGSGEVYVLDLAGERQWRQCASTQEPRQQFACGAMEVSGGSSAYEPILDAESYDFEEDSWYFHADTGEGRFKHRVTAVGKELVLQGGSKYTDYYGDWKEKVRDVRVFDFDEICAGGGSAFEEDYHARFVRTRLLEFFDPQMGDWEEHDAFEYCTHLMDTLSAGIRGSSV